MTVLSPSNACTHSTSTYTQSFIESLAKINQEPNKYCFNESLQLASLSDEITCKASDEKIAKSFFAIFKDLKKRQPLKNLSPKRLLTLQSTLESFLLRAEHLDTVTKEEALQISSTIKRAVEKKEATKTLNPLATLEQILTQETQALNKDTSVFVHNVLTLFAIERYELKVKLSIALYKYAQDILEEGFKKRGTYKPFSKKAKIINWKAIDTLTPQGFAISILLERLSSKNHVQCSNKLKVLVQELPSMDDATKKNCEMWFWYLATIRANNNLFDLIKENEILKFDNSNNNQSHTLEDFFCPLLKPLNKELQLPVSKSIDKCQLVLETVKVYQKKAEEIDRQYAKLFSMLCAFKNQNYLEYSPSIHYTGTDKTLPNPELFEAWSPPLINLKNIETILKNPSNELLCSLYADNSCFIDIFFGFITLDYSENKVHEDDIKNENSTNLQTIKKTPRKKKHPKKTTHLAPENTNTQEHDINNNSIQNPQNTPREPIKFLDERMISSIHALSLDEKKPDVNIQILEDMKSPVSSDEIKITYHDRVKDWFEKTPKAFQKESYRNLKPQIKKMVQLQHNFAAALDEYVFKIGIKTPRYSQSHHQMNDHYAIPGEIEFENGLKKRGIFTYCLDSQTKECYHRFFTEKAQEELIEEYAEKGFYNFDFPPLEVAQEKEKSSIGKSSSLHNDGSYIIEESRYVISAKDPKNQATIRLFVVGS